MDGTIVGKDHFRETFKEDNLEMITVYFVIHLHLIVTFM